MAARLTSLAAADAALARLLEDLPALADWHGRSSPAHAVLRACAEVAARALFAEDDDGPRRLGPFGPLRMPYTAMGAVDSVDLLNLDELILMAFYWANRRLYRRVADLGANLGWHSLAMARSGFEVRAFEPDPVTFQRLRANLEANDCRAVEAIEAAVAGAAGRAEFVRVLGNWTSSHLAGAKANPYGELERFGVELVAFADIIAWADLIKIDIEGQEAEILCRTGRADWDGTDALVEVGTAENAERIHAHLSRLGVGMFSQLSGWRRVASAAEMPTSYRDGTLFVSTRASMPWSLGEPRS